MAKKVIDNIKGQQINKYVVIFDDKTTIIFSEKNRVAAMDNLKELFDVDIIEKHNFSIYKVGAEVKEDKSIIKFFLDDGNNETENQ